MNELNKWAKDNNQFFKLEAGQSVIAEYKGYKIVPNNFDPDKEQIRYTLLIDGIVKYWNNGSTVIAETFSNIGIGSKVRVTKEATKDGKGKYFVESYEDGESNIRMSDSELDKIAEELNEE